MLSADGVTRSFYVPPAGSPAPVTPGLAWKAVPRPRRRPRASTLRTPCSGTGSVRRRPARSPGRPRTAGKRRYWHWPRCPRGAPHHRPHSTPVPQAARRPVPRHPPPGEHPARTGSECCCRRPLRLKCSRRARTVPPAPGPAAATLLCCPAPRSSGLPDSRFRPEGAKSHHSSPTGMPAAAITAAFRHVTARRAASGACGASCGVSCGASCWNWPWTAGCVMQQTLTTFTSAGHTTPRVPA